MTRSMEWAILLAANQAISAKKLGTYGVGALLLSKSGRILQRSHNKVIVNNILVDPTAHAERLLVDWYFAQPKHTVPSAKDITLVTSVDPCCMCAGALLVAGFKVIVAANDTYAGINFDLSATYPSLASTALRETARQTISYPAVIGDSRFARSASGSPIDKKLFITQTIDRRTLEKCNFTFEKTLSIIREKIYSDINLDHLLDISKLSVSNPIIVALKENYPHALQYKSPSKYHPDLGLAKYLKEAIDEDAANGGHGNAVALLDYFGNLILCLPGNHRRSPIHTAFMRCTRSYSRLRAGLNSYPGIERYLHPPRFGTFIFANGPDYSAQSFMDLGAYGSTMEGPLPATNPFQFQYIRPSLSQEKIRWLCSQLPPLYSREIGINPTQVTDRLLIGAIE